MGRDASPGILLRLPLFLPIWGLFALAMFVPAGYAAAQGASGTAASFLLAGLSGLIAVTLIALALGDRTPQHGAMGQLLSLLGTFTVIPLFLAVPFHDALGNARFLNVYFDMVSAITTTGADIFHDPGRLEPTLHLWRALVAWLGGLLMWVAAAAILAPLSLGGFEVTARGQPGRAVEAPMQLDRIDPRRRLVTIGRTLAPVYAGLTAVLWVLLLFDGETGLTGFCHASSVMATSGLSPVGGVQNAGSGLAGEIVMFLFMFFALSRLTFSSDTATLGHARLDRDPEFRIGLLLVTGVPALLFLRHWIGAIDVATTGDLGQAVHAFWGSMFTVMSFLSTTGFYSADWHTAQQWSGLSTPGLVLMGLALIGGGVATTAGGVKLLRVYALYLNGLRGMERLVYPSSVSSTSGPNRRIQKGGAFIAWVFFMLFALALTFITLVLTAFGVSFENAIVLSIATLSTTGPLIDIAAETPIRLLELGAGAKAILCAAMVLGRLETLAIVTLITPNLWRN